MAIRLGEHIVYGEFYNTNHYSTHGFLVLRGEGDSGDEDEVMRLHFGVTGDCSPDLKGKHIRFEPAEDDGTQIPLSREAFNKINPTQHGVTGTMTAQGWVQALPCTVEEFVFRSALGEPPPTEWRNRFFLEWFGPGGRVTVELAGATVEYCTREPDREDEDDDDDGDWEPVPNLAFPPYLEGPKAGSGPSVTRITREADAFEVQEMRPFEVEEVDLGGGDDLQQSLDAESSRIDREIAGISDDEVRKDLEQLQRMDYCMEHGEKKPMEAFIGDWSQLPRPEDLDDGAVEDALKALLVRLVAYGVVLDVCEHFTPRDCYRLLLEDILPEGGAYEELLGTAWIQHYSTYENCPKCDAEFEEEYRDS